MKEVKIVIEGLSEKFYDIIDRELSKEIKEKKEDIKSLEDLLYLDSDELEEIFKLEMELDKVSQLPASYLDKRADKRAAVKKFHEEFSVVVKWMGSY